MTETRTAKMFIRSTWQKIQLCTCSTLFCTFLCSCCCSVKLPSYTFYEGNVVCAPKKIFCLYSFSLIFTLLATTIFSLSHRHCKIFMLLFQQNLSPLFFIPRSSSLSLFFLLSFSILSPTFSLSLSFSIFQICGHCN